MEMRARWIESRGACDGVGWGGKLVKLLDSLFGTIYTWIFNIGGCHISKFKYYYCYRVIQSYNYSAGLANDRKLLFILGFLIFR